MFAMNFENGMDSVYIYIYIYIYIYMYIYIHTYIHGSVHRESNLIIVQQDATYSVYYISVGSSTCFGC